MISVYHRLNLAGAMWSWGGVGHLYGRNVIDTALCRVMGWVMESVGSNLKRWLQSLDKAFDGINN